MEKGKACRMRGACVKGSFARRSRPLTRPNGEAAAGGSQEGLKMMVIRKG